LENKQSSPRSGRQHRAWGVSLGKDARNSLKPGKRATADRSLQLITVEKSPPLSSASRAQSIILLQSPDLAPQTLASAPLRGLELAAGLRRFYWSLLRFHAINNHPIENPPPKQSFNFTTDSVFYLGLVWTEDL